MRNGDKRRHGDKVLLRDLAEWRTSEIKNKPFFFYEQIINMVYSMLVESLFIANFFFFRNSSEPTRSTEPRGTVAG